MLHRHLLSLLAPGVFAASLLAFSVHVSAQSLGGTYKGDGLTLVLKPAVRSTSRYTGTVALGTKKFAAQGKGDAQKLGGTFQSGSQSFTFSLHRSGSNATFITGNTRYQLHLQGETNPLARSSTHPLAKNPLTRSSRGSGAATKLNPNDKSGYLGLATMMDDQNQMRVFMVVEGGPAQRAGLQRGDIIRAVAGRPITNDEQMLAVMRGPVGSRVSIVAVRPNADGLLRSLHITIIRGLMPSAGNTHSPSAGGGGMNDDPDDLRDEQPDTEQSRAPATRPRGGFRAVAQPHRASKKTAPQRVSGSYPSVVQAGMRLIYSGGNATVQGSDSRLTPTGPGSARLEGLQSSGGVGYTTLDIVQTTSNFIAADVRHFLIGYGGATTLRGQSVVTGNAGELGDNFFRYWMSPRRLATMKNGRRVRYNFGGRTVSAISIGSTGNKGYVNEIYDLQSGLLLSSSRSNRGNAQPTIGPDNRVVMGQGANQQSHLRLIATRKRTMPWANSSAPAWAHAGTRLSYNGQVENVMLNSGLPPFPPSGASYSCIINRVVGGCVLASTLARFDNGVGIPPSENQTNRIFATTSIGSLWVPPTAIRKLRPGQVIDQDQFTHYRLSFAGVQNGAAVFIDQGQSDQFVYAYNPQTGMLTSFSSTTRPTTIAEQRLQFRLEGVG